MSTSTAFIYLDTNRTIAPISPWIFGGFAEHMGRCIYEGIYDPASPLADECGLRTDVLDALREQQYTIMRYPGGNFLSGYNWLDGVGPKAERPRRRPLRFGEPVLFFSQRHHQGANLTLENVRRSIEVNKGRQQCGHLCLGERNAELCRADLT